MMIEERKNAILLKIEEEKAEKEDMKEALAELGVTEDE